MRHIRHFAVVFMLMLLCTTALTVQVSAAPSLTKEGNATTGYTITIADVNYSSYSLATSAADFIAGALTPFSDSEKSDLTASNVKTVIFNNCQTMRVIKNWAKAGESYNLTLNSCLLESSMNTFKATNDHTILIQNSRFPLQNFSVYLDGDVTFDSGTFGNYDYSFTVKNGATLRNCNFGSRRYTVAISGNNNTLENLTTTYTSYGTWLTLSGKCDNTTITNCDFIFTPAASAPYILYGDNLTFTNNRCRRGFVFVGDNLTIKDNTFGATTSSELQYMGTNITFKNNTCSVEPGTILRDGDTVKCTNFTFNSNSRRGNMLDSIYYAYGVYAFPQGTPADKVIFTNCTNLYEPVFNGITNRGSNGNTYIKSDVDFIDCQDITNWADNYVVPEEYTVNFTNCSFGTYYSTVNVTNATFENCWWKYANNTNFTLNNTTVKNPSFGNKTTAYTGGFSCNLTNNSRLTGLPEMNPTSVNLTINNSVLDKIDGFETSPSSVYLYLTDTIAPILPTFSPTTFALHLYGGATCSNLRYTPPTNGSSAITITCTGNRNKLINLNLGNKYYNFTLAGEGHIIDGLKTTYISMFGNFNFPAMLSNVTIKNSNLTSFYDTSTRNYHTWKVNCSNCTFDNNTVTGKIIISGTKNTVTDNDFRGGYYLEGGIFPLGINPEGWTVRNNTGAPSQMMVEYNSLTDTLTVTGGSFSATSSQTLSGVHTDDVNYSDLHYSLISSVIRSSGVDYNGVSTTEFRRTTAYYKIVSPYTDGSYSNHTGKRTHTCTDSNGIEHTTEYSYPYVNTSHPGSSSTFTYYGDDWTKEPNGTRITRQYIGTDGENFYLNTLSFTKQSVSHRYGYSSFRGWSTCTHCGKNEIYNGSSGYISYDTHYYVSDYEETRVATYPISKVIFNDVTFSGTMQYLSDYNVEFNNCFFSNFKTEKTHDNNKTLRFNNAKFMPSSTLDILANNIVINGAYFSQGNLILRPYKSLNMDDFSNVNATNADGSKIKCNPSCLTVQGNDANTTIDITNCDFANTNNNTFTPAPGASIAFRNIKGTASNLKFIGGLDVTASAVDISDTDTTTLRMSGIHSSNSLRSLFHDSTTKGYITVQDANDIDAVTSLVANHTINIGGGATITNSILYPTSITCRATNDTVGTPRSKILNTALNFTSTLSVSMPVSNKQNNILELDLSRWHEACPANSTCDIVVNGTSGYKDNSKLIVPKLPKVKFRNFNVRNIEYIYEGSTPQVWEDSILTGVLDAESVHFHGDFDFEYITMSLKGAPTRLNTGNMEFTGVTLDNASGTVFSTFGDITMTNSYINNQPLKFNGLSNLYSIDLTSTSFSQTYSPCFDVAGIYKDINLNRVTSTLNKDLVLNAAVNRNETINLKNSQFGKLSSTSPSTIQIDGGNYLGDPAINAKRIVIVEGVVTDVYGVNGGNRRSSFTLGENSTQTSRTDGNAVITTISIKNPPIEIDWGDFPGFDLDLDLNAPTIEVLRKTSSGAPASTTTPYTEIYLDISCSDPDGHDDDNPLSINGGAFQPTPVRNYRVTENQAISIMARDANGNVRSFIVNVNNIDTEGPEILAINQSNQAWTKDPVTIAVTANDDVKLSSTAYKYEFTPNSAVSEDSSGNQVVDESKVTVTDWTAAKTYRVAESGTVRVCVRDLMSESLSGNAKEAHQTWSEPYHIRNIDTYAPSAEVVYSVAEDKKVSAQEGVTVQLNIIDVLDPVTYESAGLSATPVLWNASGNSRWLKDEEYTYHENGNYTVRVRDAVGNISKEIPINITQISSSEPVIDEFTGTHINKEYTTAPVILHVYARDQDVPKPGSMEPYEDGTFDNGLPDKPYSWDGGKTWTSLNTKQVYSNGEYSVLVRDYLGTVKESSLIISNIDSHAPTAAIYMYKGAPSDWDYSIRQPEVADYVWKLRIEASDIGSGVDTIQTLWDNGTHSGNAGAIIFEIEEAGVYGVIVEDKAGNRTYAEKTISSESIGQGGYGGGGNGTNGSYTDIKVPSDGSAGPDFSADGKSSLNDLIFAPQKVYNAAENKLYNYPDGKRGIPVHLAVTGKRNNWITGSATFIGLSVPLTFPDSNSIQATGQAQNAQAFFPIDQIKEDVKNGRIKVVVKEWDKQPEFDVSGNVSNGAKIVKEGSATLYTSTAISKPTLNFTYNKVTGDLTVTGAAPVAGIKGIYVDVGGDSGYQDYDGPINLSSIPDEATIKMKVEDNAGNVTEKELPKSDLPLNGGAGGGGGIPPVEGTNPDGSPVATDKNGNAVNSYHTSNRAADIYIIGGTTSNTSTVPDSSIYGLAG